MADNKDIFKNEYLPYIVKWGKLTSWLGVLLSFGPALVLLVVFGIMPPGGAILTGFISIASAIGVNWIVEPISYFPIVGVAGTYMAFVTGNISNLRIPCAAIAQTIAEVEPGTDEGTIASTLGMGVSVVVNIVVLIFGVFAGQAILNALPPGVVAALNYLLPALFGAIFIQFALMRLNLAPIAITIALVLNILVNNGFFAFLPGGPKPGYVSTIGSVFGTIAIGVMLYKRSNAANADKPKQ